MVRDAKKYMQDHAGTTRAHIVQRHAHIARIHIMCIHTTTGGMSHSAQCKIQSSWQDQGQSSQVGASYLSNCIGCWTITLALAFMDVIAYVISVVSLLHRHIVEAAHYPEVPRPRLLKNPLSTCRSCWKEKWMREVTKVRKLESTFNIF